ncbi:hypothetical protein [Tissierella praeacuta]|uniref:hypothetical protein n=1 Tax=Tissierella praeacuta TaxID=43131 RepID=UPI0028AC0357|nr:hypothetical protein [Tissierella praeacuta]
MLSTKEFRFTAENIPAGIPIIQDTTAADTASLSVLGNASNSKSATGRFNLYETPKSP